MLPWTSPYGYANFVERSGSWDRFDQPERMTRLRAVKAAYDPHGVIVGAHDIAAH